MSVDNVLKLYSETIRSSFLHYGFWDNPSEINLESLTLQDLKIAQLRYAEHLCSYIPSNVNSILDVGCGIGGNAKYLLSKGFDVETLSPDDYQKKVISDKFNKKMIGSKWDKKKEQLDLIDSEKFKKYRKYMIYLFKKK